MPDVRSTIQELRQHDVVSRIWRRDHTVWKSDPTELADRLGWLDVMDFTSGHLPELETFSRQVRESGVRHVVLLGMGGSSLGPEVLRRTLGGAAGYPELIVLDSTVPTWVQSVTDAIDPARTLFLVSSKSGTTVEPGTFYSYFRGLVEQAVGVEGAGERFVAVTDPGSVLEELAHREGFRKSFANPTDIGGRYSVLSYFGMVPAALTGMDVHKLLDSAGDMRLVCGNVGPVAENPGAALGGEMAGHALNGRDKLTLVTSPSLDGFGLWVEQLIAESTGKEGKGIVPIAGEPLLGPEAYGDDRLFVYMRIDDDDNGRTDDAIENIEASGHPVVRLDLKDRYDIGGEFYRWEFATAVAGAVMKINPFDQPNVQQAKDISVRMLEDFASTGEAPELESIGSVDALLANAKPGDYLAIMAYVLQTPELDEALSGLRTRVMRRYKIATTLGYGPRFLHSTGQLHKGGANTGLFLQITSRRDRDLDIPGEEFSFGVLADAQARGDLGALQSSSRRVARVHLDSEDPEALRKLIAETD
ncbi:MAG: glucose-6-phosphate isomerase [Chloroflexi bacterium]|nr:glucose-6-phosphate isomerase [Chloroflexota bacterium]